MFSDVLLACEWTLVVSRTIVIARFWERTFVRVTWREVSVRSLLMYGIRIREEQLHISDR